MANQFLTVRETSDATLVFMDMAAATADMPSRPAKPVTETTPNLQLQTPAPWSYWGDDNLKPQQMIADIKSCGILSSIIDGKARFAICEGLVPVITKINDKGESEIVKYVDDPEIKKFLETNRMFYNLCGWLRDNIGLGNANARLILSKDGTKITTILRHDMSEVRYAIKDKQTNRIETVYYSANWDKMFTQGNEPELKLPLLDFYNPLEDLQNKAAAGTREVAYAFRYPGWGEHYYSSPLWYAALKWVRIAQGIPEMKAAMFQNSIHIKYHIEIHPDYWNKCIPGFTNKTEDEQVAAKNAFYDEVSDYLTGAKNAHKTIFSETVTNALTGAADSMLKITKIEGGTIDGELVKDSSTANSEIAFALLFNPAIIGASLPSGPYTNSQGGSNVRESVLLQIILHEMERQEIKHLMNIVKYYNGWDETYPGLDFIIPATVLTTLDTGSSSKPVITGGNNSTNNNGTDPNNTGN